MVKRRTVMATGLAMAGIAPAAGTALAQSGAQSKAQPGKPMLVFVGHAL